MTAALAYKEFRETVPIAVLALAAFLFYALTSMGYAPLPNVFGSFAFARPGQGIIPFLGDPLIDQFKNVAFCLALALGFSQSLRDFWGDGQLFLLHRPVSRKHVYSVKLAVGLATYLICSLVPIVLYAAWAATPGTHASPFEWSMTRDVWTMWLGMTAIYLGAFLSGIRPGAWVGTRLMPLAAAGLTGFIASYFIEAWTGATWGSTLYLMLANVVLVYAIFRVVETRDFV